MCAPFIIEVFVKIGALYPPALADIPLKLNQRFFGQSLQGLPATFPSFEFLLEFPHLGDFGQAAANVTALVNSFALLTAIVNPLRTENERAAVIGSLVKLSHGTRYFARAAARSLINIAKFDLFHSAFECFRCLLKDGDRVALFLYLEMAAYNFSPAFNRFEKRYHLSADVATTMPKQQAEFKSISRLSTGDSKNVETIFDVIRMLDGIQMCEDGRIAMFVHEKALLPFLSRYLPSLARAGVPLLDARLAVPFAHLCTSCVQLLRGTVPDDDAGTVNPGVGFLLLVFKQIALSAPCQSLPLTSVGADILLERRRIARAVVDYLPALFIFAVKRVEKGHFSEVDSLLFLAADVLSADRFTLDHVKDLILFMASSFESLITSESALLFNAHVTIWARFYECLHPNGLKRFLPAVREAFAKAMEQRREFVMARILVLLGRLARIPEAKLGFLADEDLNATIDVICRCLKPEFAEDFEAIALSACEFLTHMSSISITCNQGFDRKLRAATESLPKRCMEQVTLAISKLLDVQRSIGFEPVWKAALRFLRFACASPYYTAEIFDFPEFSLTMRDVYAAGMLTHEVARLLVGLATEVARVDPKYAQKLIGFDDRDLFLIERDEAYDRIVGEFLNVLDHEERRPNDTFRIETIQEGYALNAPRYISAKSNASSPALPRSPFMVPLPIDGSLFFEAITLPVEPMDG
jgi:hypothetical protein